MTDRLKGCVVVFEREIREDDAEGLFDAILRLRGVASVIGSINNHDDYMNREMVRREFVGKLWKALEK